MTTTNISHRGECIVNHSHNGWDRYPQPCHGPATHLIRHPNWGVTLECCTEVANACMKRDDRYELLAWDSVEHHVRAGQDIPKLAADYVLQHGLTVVAL